LLLPIVLSHDLENTSCKYLETWNPRSSQLTYEAFANNEKRYIICQPRCKDFILLCFINYKDIFLSHW
jgi:hypothetical protein